MDIHTRQLRYFMELAKCLNFTKAAVNLYIAQPALSQQIADLEKQLGVTLFIRNSRSVALTPAGSLLRDSCSTIFNQLEDLEKRLRLAEAGIHGELKIGYLSEPYLNKLPRLVRQFKERYPDISLTLHQYNMRTIRIALEQNSIDIAFTFLFPDDVAANTVFSSMAIGQDDLCLVVHETHPFVRSGQADHTLLEQETFFVVDDEIAPNWSFPFRDACAALGIVPMRQKREKQLETIMLQVEANLGVSILPTALSNLSLPHTRFIPIDELHMTKGVLWNTNNQNASLPFFLEEMDILFHQEQEPSQA